MDHAKEARAMAGPVEEYVCNEAEGCFIENGKKVGEEVA